MYTLLSDNFSMGGGTEMIVKLRPERVIIFYRFGKFRALRVLIKKLTHRAGFKRKLSHVAMFGWDFWENYHMLLGMGGAYRNF